MKTEEAGKVIARLTAAFNRDKPMDPPECGVWLEHLDPKDFDTAMRACRIAEAKCKRRPPLSEFLEMYLEARFSNRGSALPPPECWVCDGGWIIVRCEGCDCGESFNLNDRKCFKMQTNVLKCPQGCVSPSQEQREARWRQEEADWGRARRAEEQRDIDRRVNAFQSARQTELRPTVNSAGQFADVRDPSEPRRDDDSF